MCVHTTAGRRGADVHTTACRAYKPAADRCAGTHNTVRTNLHATAADRRAADAHSAACRAHTTAAKRCATC